LRRIQNLENDIRFTRYRLSFPLCTATRAVLEGRMETLLLELAAAHAACKRPLPKILTNWHLSALSARA
jgi:hypothetical protein